MNQIWEAIVRFRTWIVNVVASLLILLPELLNAPEVLAVIPQQYQKYVFVAALILNIVMRPRPAAMAKDPEVQIAKAIATNDKDHA
jgi:predicted cobalt transporter CbtA